MIASVTMMRGTMMIMANILMNVVPFTYSEKKIFLKTIQNHSLTVKTCFALSLGFILCIYSR